MNLSDYLVSLIRTGVPAAVSFVASLLAAHFGVVIDEHTKAQGVLALTAFVFGIYYAVVRAAETRWPQIGWLFGIPKAPAYTTPPDAPGPVATIAPTTSNTSNTGNTVTSWSGVWDDVRKSIDGSAEPRLVTRIIDETVVDGQRLGRHVLHDARSLDYLARDLIDRNAPVVTKLWVFPGKPLDQKATGSCTGNATTHLLRVLAGKVGKLNEAAARKVYSLATHLDATPGYWPPTDTGSDGLSALKAAQQLGLFTGAYRWCLGIDDVLAVLSQHGPVIIGIPWYEGFDTPASDATVTISGRVRGGHEVCVIGVNAEAKTVQLVNSWGPSYGIGGHFQMSWDTLSRLLHEQGDAATVA